MVEVLKACDIDELFAREFLLCALAPDERVVVLTEPASRQDYVGAAYIAGSSLAREVVVLTVAGGSLAPFASTRTGAGPGLRSLSSGSLSLGLLEAADFVVDLTIEGFFHNEVLGDVLAAGTRVLYVSDPPEVLERNLSSPQDKARALAATEILARGKQMRVVSSAGTDLVADIVDSNPGFQCGFADDPGRWDHWPSAMVTCWPKTSSGTVVLQAGDVLLPFKTFVRDDVALEVVDGRIVEISGGADGRFLDRFFDDAGDEEARSLSHMGWGLMRSADWFSMAMYDKETYVGQDVRSFRGNFLLSTGPDPFVPRKTPYHLDIPLRDCSVLVDDVPVVADGQLVVDERMQTARLGSTRSDNGR